MKKKKVTSKNLESCSTRLSSARIRCLPLVSAPPPPPPPPPATGEETATSSTDDAVSDAITVPPSSQTQTLR